MERKFYNVGYTTLNQSILIKELGFNYFCTNYYNKNGKLSEKQGSVDTIQMCSNSDLEDKEYTRATFYQMQRWLEIKYEIKMSIYYYRESSDKFMLSIRGLVSDILLWESEKHSVYQESIERLISQSLDIILSNRNFTKIK